MTEDRSPTLRLRELGSRLRDLRLQAGLTLDEVAAQLMVSAPQVSRIETGKRTASPRDIRDLCDFYGVEDAAREQLMALAREAKQPGWWQSFDDLAIGRLIGLETEAARISTYQSMVIPWAFQTRDYAHAVLKGTLPKIEDRILDERVKARLLRQNLLTKENPPHLWTLIDESGLRRQVGGSAVMREQRARIIELADLSNIVMQVVPYEAGAHPGIDSTFTLLEFSDPHQSPVAYSETLAGWVYLERPADIARYREALEYLESCALSVTASIELIENIN